MANIDIKYYKLEDILDVYNSDGDRLFSLDTEADKKEYFDINDDFDIKPNEKDQRTIDFIKRQQEVVKKVKKHFNYKEQIKKVKDILCFYDNII